MTQKEMGVKIKKRNENLGLKERIKTENKFVRIKDRIQFKA